VGREGSESSASHVWKGQFCIVSRLLSDSSTHDFSSVVVLAATSLCLLATGVLAFGSDLPLLDWTVVAYQILYGFTGLVFCGCYYFRKTVLHVKLSASGTHSKWSNELCTCSLWGESLGISPSDIWCCNLFFIW